MGRIAERFARLRERGEKALIPYLAGGDPDLETTGVLVRALEEAGADLIEIGVPFSDPSADGPTIQRASERALRGGATLRGILQLVRDLRPRIEVPLLLMGYANPFYAMGPEGFAETAAEVGVDGVICPDLPPEEGADLYAALEARGVDGVLLASPTTTDARLALLARRTRGFLYYVSLTGVTSARGELAPGLAGEVARVREASPLPVCVGFGISRPEHAAEVGGFADGVVVGSAVVDRIERAVDRDDAVASVGAFVRSMKEPLRTVVQAAGSGRSSSPRSSA